jgi:hypothetical protein
VFVVYRRKLKRAKFLRELKRNIKFTCREPNPRLGSMYRTRATTAGLLDGRLVPEASSKTSESHHEERVAKSDPASGVMKRTEVAECSGICGMGESDAETLLAKKLTRTFNEFGQA